MKKRVSQIIQFFDWIFIKKFYSENEINGVSGVILHLKFHFYTFFRIFWLFLE